jgi:hypothetical protein
MLGAQFLHRSEVFLKNLRFFSVFFETSTPPVDRWGANYCFMAMIADSTSGSVYAGHKLSKFP